MTNLAEAEVRSDTLVNLQHRLDALLLVLKTCVGDVCRNPWKSVFPDGSVSSLKAALAKSFDGYFADLPKVKYSVSPRSNTDRFLLADLLCLMQYCDIGYHRRLEAPFWYEELAFQNGQKDKFVIQA